MEQAAKCDAEITLAQIRLGTYLPDSNLTVIVCDDGSILNNDASGIGWYLRAYAGGVIAGPLFNTHPKLRREPRHRQPRP